MPGRLRDPGSGASARLRPGSSDDADANADGYESWSLAELRARAAELGLAGRSRLNRAGLVEALQAHAEPAVPRRTPRE